MINNQIQKFVDDRIDAYQLYTILYVYTPLLEDRRLLKKVLEPGSSTDDRDKKLYLIIKKEH